MPYTMRKLKGGKVRVSSPHGVKAKASTPEDAAAQKRLLEGIEHNPTFARKIRAEQKSKS